MTAPAIFVDAQDPAFVENPYPTFARLRRESPVHWLEKSNVWFICKYADILSISRDRDARFTHQFMDVSSLRPEARGALAQRESDYASGVAGDPPGHTRRRRAVAKVFTPGVTQREQEPYVRAIAEELVGAIVRDVPVGGSFEFVTQFSGPLPTLVIARIMGVPREMHAKLHALTETAIGGAADRRVPIDVVVAADRELRELLFEVFDELRKHPGDDLTSHLVRAVEAGDVSEQEAKQIMYHLFFAGNETTTHWFNNALHALLTHPEEYQKVLDDRSLITNFTEEALRWDSSVIGTMKKIALEDIEIRGQVVRKGQRVYQVYGAANRDEEVFDDPERFDVMRHNADQHLSFGGGGPHLCIGWPLARIEAQIGWHVLLEQLPHLQLGPGPAVRNKAPNLRGFDSLPVTRLS